MGRCKKTLPKPLRILLGSLALLLAVSLLCALCFLYVGGLNRTLRDETQTYLQEVSSHITNTLESKVDAQFRNLETIASTLDIENSGSNAAWQFLMREAARYGYQSMYIADTKGFGRSTAGQSIDARSSSCFQKALLGTNALSSVVLSPKEGSRLLAYAVPIRQDGRITGVLGAFVDEEATRKALDIDSFHGEGFCHIVRRNGDVVMSSNHESAVTGVTNCYSLWENSELEAGVTVERLRADFAAGRQGTFVVRPDDTKKYISYQPLNINDWYLLTVVPVDTVSAQTNYFVRGTALLCGVLALLFLLLLLVIVRQQQRSKRSLRQMAFQDPVTGGRNARRFALDAAELLRGAAPCQYAMAVLNIKGFKLINEAFGQKNADRVLRHIYQKIDGSLAEKETAARLFSDQFAVLFHYTGKESCVRRLRRLVEEINRFNQEREDKYYLMFSQGVYVVEDPALDLITIQDRANVARKSAKSHAGADEPVFYLDVARLQMMREKDMENRMYQALENGEFLIYLQPKFSLEDDSITGAEALIRWDHPETGLISPSEFIPLFEQNGFITKLDNFAFRKVCHTLRRWLDCGMEPVPISVNLSRVHLYDPDFLKRYRDICYEAQVPPGLIEIEVTETLMFENVALLSSIVHEMHDIGFVCSLDDFGSGYSSLNLLKDVPVDILKLDCAFFQSEHNTSARGRTVIQGVLELAKRLRMKTVAEGVERMETVQFLRSANCDMVQGFFFSKPLPVSDFEKLAYGETFE